MSRATGVALLNLGGPERPEDVEPFLYNLFADREIIRLGPWFMQRFIARRIARSRAPASIENYEKIGGGSPILRITRAQARALEHALAAHGDFHVEVAMRYWRPRAREALEALAARGARRVVALPLYPHYSRATTGSSLRDLRRAARRVRPRPELLEITAWPDQPDYIACLADFIRQGLEAMGPETALVYSAHSLPQSLIDQGDPYVEHIQRTIAALEKRTHVPGRLCFQSRSGPVRWLEPSTPDMLGMLAREQVNKVLVVPISFVSDHVETLYEIDILYAEQARDLGMELRSTPGLNIEPGFIRGLRDMVLERAGEG